MKVKVFGNNDIKTLQQNINEWLESEKPIIEFIKQSGGAERGWETTISIWYSSVATGRKAGVF